ncbi:high affinity cGMP-specific 3',5'-cyclic phosphodiesterase 9A [Zeugodacus cucurbitae]|uniref:high affinity cGMP-specific 3',5'-cyclic phosphodiesterase 9A n=1 Tax=Zeugodacus cucurbitae TaxID=28588 RepID=UPI0005968CAD|nr:high affinity cGMP-specific 3',5'-cyclic phosphodiesterase 9A [Zeugodacus cucurbitae]
MLLKLICVITVTLTLVSAAPKKKTSDEHIAALFVKDSDNGELRFLTGTSSVNQLITQKQDFLEQLRPTNGANNNIRPIYIDLNGGGIETTSPTVGFGGGGGGGGGNGNGGVLGAVASNASPVGDLLPQIVGQVVAGGGGATSPSTASSPSTPTYPDSPPNSIPESAAAGVGQNPGRRRVVRRGNKRRQGNRNTNKRRRNRRRPARRNQQKRKVVLLRPQRN